MSTDSVDGLISVIGLVYGTKDTLLCLTTNNGGETMERDDYGMFPDFGELHDEESDDDQGPDPLDAWNKDFEEEDIL